MNIENTARIILITMGLLLIFVCGVVVGRNRGFPYDALVFIRDSVAQVYNERYTLAALKPEHFLQPSRYDGNGITVNKVPKGGFELVLLAGFFENSNGIRLLERDGTNVANWPVRFFDIFPDASHLPIPPTTDWNIDIHGALVEPDGSVVFNFEYGGLIKLTRCGDVVWALPRATHHSVERDHEGNYWVPGRRLVSGESASSFPPFETPFYEDTILQVSDDGQILTEISVPELIYDNGLEAILTSSGHSFMEEMSWDREIVHVNKIDPLTPDIANDFPMFDAGDLAVSMRTLNAVMVVDPETRLVKWWHIGPWLRQHDPEFKAGGTIVVFNNNQYRTAFGTSPDRSPPSPTRFSNIVEIDPVSRTSEVIYGNGEDQQFLSVIRGKHELMPGGGLLVTEFEGGRVFETDQAGNLIWEYINRFSAEEVAEITEARAYPTSYFSVGDWSCEHNG